MGILRKMRSLRFISLAVILAAFPVCADDGAIAQELKDLRKEMEALRSEVVHLQNRLDALGSNTRRLNVLNP